MALVYLATFTVKINYTNFINVGRYTWMSQEARINGLGSIAYNLYLYMEYIRVITH